MNTPVYAPADGTVTFRQSYSVKYHKLASYGNNFVFVSSDGKYKVTCAHLSSFNNVRLAFTQSLAYPCSSNNYKCSTTVLEERTVRKGDLIGYTGMTGNASGPHIHIEVRKNGTPVDPKSVFKTW
jgi:murein DD-endopeptidase MepM/ murein hydrolase activator NlpD